MGSGNQKKLYSAQEAAASIAQMFGNTGAAISGIGNNPSGVRAGQAVAEENKEIQGNLEAQRAYQDAEKKRKKQEQGSTFGSLGSILGTAAGYALAPVTGGLSIPASMALGGGLGGVAGGMAGGQSPMQAFQQFGMPAAAGGIAGGYGGATPLMQGMMQNPGLQQMPGMNLLMMKQMFPNMFGGGGGSPALTSGGSETGALGGDSF